MCTPNTKMHRLKGGSDKKEVDAGSQSSSIRKRKASADRSKPPSGYLQAQEWVHQSRPFMAPTPQYDPQCSPLVGPYWEVAGSPRMFAAFSDPSVCRYSVPAAHPPPPLTYSYEPVSLPIYQQANPYQPMPVGSNWGSWRSPQHVGNRTPVKQENSKRARRPRMFRAPKVGKSSTSHHATNGASSHDPLSSHSVVTQEEYLSLPPGIQQECDLDDSHRRFSDPGLAHTESDGAHDDNHEEDHDSKRGSEWSHDSSASTAESAVLSAEIDAAALSEQLNLLKADNKRLARELRDTRAELHKLKLQAATWSNPVQQDYQPGMIADLVREVRDAAQLREETLLSRLRLMMSDGGVMRLPGASVQEKEALSSGLNPSHHQSSTNNSDVHSLDESKDSERIARLERQLSSMQLQNGNEAPVHASRRDEDLRRELQEAQTARKMAESNVNKLERLVAILRKKMNGVNLNVIADDGKPADPVPTKTDNDVIRDSPAPSSLESLTSACSSSLGSGPSGPATITLAGPVTDL